MWRLYTEYETAMQMTEQFNPLREIDVHPPAAAAPAPLTTAQIVQQIVQLAQAGVVIGQGVTEAQVVNLAAAMIPFVTGGQAPSSNKIRLDGIRGAYVESPARTDVFKTDLSLERAKVTTQQGPQDVVKQEVLWQRWEREN